VSPHRGSPGHAARRSRDRGWGNPFGRSISGLRWGTGGPLTDAPAARPDKRGRLTCSNPPVSARRAALAVRISNASMTADLSSAGRAADFRRPTPRRSSSKRRLPKHRSVSLWENRLAPQKGSSPVGLNRAFLGEIAARWKMARRDVFHCSWPQREKGRPVQSVSRLCRLKLRAWSRRQRRRDLPETITLN